MYRIHNGKNQIVNLDLQVSGKSWKETLQPYSDLLVTTDAHFRALQPYLEFFQLTVHTDDDHKNVRPVSHIEIVSVPSAPSRIAHLEISLDDDTDVQEMNPLYKELTVAQLRSVCEERGLPTTGKRDDILHRLHENDLLSESS